MPGTQRPLSATSSQLSLYVDSSHCLDCINEDFNKDEISQATGYIGQSSEISWIHSLGRDINGDTEHGTPSEAIFLSISDSSPISASNYHVDDQELPNIERQEAYALPSKDVASKLYNCYLDWVHPTFPIIGTTPFGKQFHAFFNDTRLHTGNKWLAVLNLLFAIAARYAYISEAEWQLNKNNHWLYFSRARVLSIDDWSFHHPDLQQLQVEGLTALYMLSLGHVNRYVYHVGRDESAIHVSAYEYTKCLENLWKCCSGSPWSWVASAQHEQVCFGYFQGDSISCMVVSLHA